MCSIKISTCAFFSPLPPFLSRGITLDIMLKNELVRVVRKLGSKLPFTRQKCVKVRSDQTDAIAKVKKRSLLVGCHPTPILHSNAWEWYWCGCCLTFTHFCLVTGNLLPNFLTTVNHSFLNIMSSVIPLDENGGSGEKNAQVEILI